MADTVGQNSFNNANGLVPIIFSKKVGLIYAKKSKVLELITNDNWEGEVKTAGDRVRIVLPSVDGITISTGGEACPTPGSIDAEALDLVIDKQMNFRFDITDKEKAQTQFKNYEDGVATAVAEKIATERAKEVMQNIFEYTNTYNMTADSPLPTSPSAPTVAEGYNYTEYNATKHKFAGDFNNGDYDDTSIQFGTDAAPLDINPHNAYAFMLQVKMALLKSGAIADDGTYSFKPLDEEAQDMRAVFVCGPTLATILLQAWQLAGRSGAFCDMVVENGVVKKVAGMEVHIDRLLETIDTTVGAGATTTGSRKKFNNLPYFAGTKNAITKASQISKVVVSEDPYCFNTIVKGMELYGFKILHPEALVRGVAKKPAGLLDGSVPVTVVNTEENPVNTKEATA